MFRPYCGSHIAAHIYLLDPFGALGGNFDGRLGSPACQLDIGIICPFMPPKLLPRSAGSPCLICKDLEPNSDLHYHSDAYMQRVLPFFQPLFWSHYLHSNSNLVLCQFVVHPLVCTEFRLRQPQSFSSSHLQGIESWSSNTLLHTHDCTVLIRIPANIIIGIITKVRSCSSFDS